MLPNLLFVGALLMLLAATTRSMMLVYVGVLAFLVLWITAWRPHPRTRQRVGGGADRSVRAGGAAPRDALLLDRRSEQRPAGTGRLPAGQPRPVDRGPLAMCTATIMLFKPQRA
ncbi:hypothetical protein LP419_35565 [Massilia sp. H-1]|nr:hypothetical protein LP419_35565 [Massilia sp. H-1]